MISRALLLAILLPFPASANMEAEVMLQMINSGELGLSAEEGREAARALRRTFRIDLNKVRSVRAAASPELRRVVEDSTLSPFDGSEGLSGGSLPAIPLGAPGGREVDSRTGRPREKASRGTAIYTVSGECTSDVDRAVRDLRHLVLGKVGESDAAEGPGGEFFIYAADLFYPRAGEPPPFPMPTFVTGTAALENAVATYSSGDPGTVAVDCKKFAPFSQTMRRKILCHELYHWYQQQINRMGDERPAYGIMGRC